MKSENIEIPNHLLGAFYKAVESIKAEGFVYSYAMISQTDEVTGFTISCTLQQAIGLGMRINKLQATADDFSSLKKEEQIFYYLLRPYAYSGVENVFKIAAREVIKADSANRLRSFIKELKMQCADNGELMLGELGRTMFTQLQKL